MKAEDVGGKRTDLDRCFDEFTYYSNYYPNIVKDIYKELCWCYHGNVQYPACVRLSKFDTFLGSWRVIRVRYWNLLLGTLEERYPEIAMEYLMLGGLESRNRVGW